MTQKLIIFFFTIIFALSCSDKKSDESLHKVDGKSLKKMIVEALWGSEKANFNLSGLIQNNTPPPDDVDHIFIDSTENQSGKKLYSVLMVYPNPTFNILAVYDNNLVLYLQDNSLNGNITTKWQTLSDRKYLIASENFLSKDFLKLSRISLYTFVNSEFRLVFRSFTKFDKTSEVYRQTIEKMDSDRISTRITSNTKSILNDTTDDFNFDSAESKYFSNHNTFTNFILDEISKANWKLEKPELIKEIIEKSEKDSGKVSSDQTQNKITQQIDNPVVKPKGYQIALNSDWSAPVSNAATEYLISRLDGFKYVNTKNGAQIMVIPLPEGSSLAQFVKYKFGKPTNGDYRVRQTEIIQDGNYRIQFFEHSCEEKSYLLLLKAPADSYSKFKSSYNSIINSFFIEC